MTNKASFLRLNQQMRQHAVLKEVLVLIILILTRFNLSNTYLGLKNYHITRTFLLLVGNWPETTVHALLLVKRGV